jgi:hypothetical protein
LSSASLWESRAGAMKRVKGTHDGKERKLRLASKEGPNRRR